MTSRHRPTAPTAALILFRDLIRERTGVFFPDSSLDLLHDKIETFLAEQAADSLLDSYYQLKYDASPAEWNALIDSIVVRETFFWREFEQVRTLTNTVLPRLESRSDSAPVQIWCAACASGEEPLTIAMALDLAGWFDRLPIEIHASDVSPAALRAAQTGVYRERCFRALPQEYRDRFFVPIQGGWKVQPAIHRRIQWRQVNLADPCAVEKMARVPVIFCRNVFIYFSDQTILNVVRTMERHMRTPGYLFLGAAESLLRFDVGFHLEEIAGAFVYVKQ